MELKDQVLAHLPTQIQIYPTLTKHTIVAKKEKKNKTNEKYTLFFSPNNKNTEKKNKSCPVLR